MDIPLKQSLLNSLGFQSQDTPAKSLCWPWNNETSITRKGQGVLYLIQKNCKTWSGSPDGGDRCWPAKSPLERSHSVSGYPMAVTGVLKRLIVSTVGKVWSIKAAKPRVHPHEEGSLMAELSGVSQQDLSRLIRISQESENKPLETLRHGLWARKWNGQCQGMTKDMKIGQGHF